MKGSMHRRHHSGRRHRAKYRVAFTLIEVLFGIALLGFLAIAFSAAFPLASRMQSSARYRAQAVRIARRELEAVRGLPYTSLASYSTLYSAAVVDNTITAAQPYSFTSLANSGDDGLTTVAQALPGGSGSLRVDEVTTADPSVVSATATNLRRITVTVSWTDPSVRTTTRTVTLQSLVAYLEKKK